MDACVCRVGQDFGKDDGCVDSTIPPRKRTNVPWKSMVGSDVFPIESSSLFRGHVRFRGCKYNCDHTHLLFRWDQIELAYYVRLDQIRFEFRWGKNIRFHQSPLRKKHSGFIQHGIFPSKKCVWVCGVLFRITPCDPSGSWIKITIWSLHPSCNVGVVKSCLRSNMAIWLLVRPAFPEEWRGVDGLAARLVVPVKRDQQFFQGNVFHLNHLHVFFLGIFVSFRGSSLGWKKW